MDQPEGGVGVRYRIAVVEGDCLAQERPGARKVLERHPVDEVDRLHHQVVGIHALWTLAQCPPELSLADVGGETPNDASRNAVLQVEQLGELAVVTISPDH